MMKKIGITHNSRSFSMDVKSVISHIFDVGMGVYLVTKRKRLLRKEDTA